MRARVILTTLLSALIATAVSAAPPQKAPRPAAVLDDAPAGTVVMDDDDGRVQIVPRRAVAPRAPTYHGGPVIAHEALRALFLGSGWRQAGRTGAARALDLLTRDGVPPLVREDPLDPPAGDRISDLEIQARLAEWVEGRAAEPLDQDAVFVVFLAPGLRSTLGASTAEHDYAAYHNHFHAAPGAVRYVVVPYDQDTQRWLHSTRQSLLQALINPDGNGWY